MYCRAVLARSRIEHLPLVIDNTITAFGSHTTTTKWMRRRRLLPHYRACKWVLHVAASNMSCNLRQGHTETLIDRFVFCPRPTQIEAVAV